MCSPDSVNALDKEDVALIQRYQHLLPKSTLEDEDQLSNLLHIIVSDTFIKEMTWEKEVTVSLKNSNNVLHVPKKVSVGAALDKKDLVFLVDLEKDKSFICPLVKNSTVPSKISLYKGWIDYLDQERANLRVKDKLRFQFDYPSSSFSVEIIRKTD